MPHAELIQTCFTTRWNTRRHNAIIRAASSATMRRHWAAGGFPQTYWFKETEEKRTVLDPRRKQTEAWMRDSPSIVPLLPRGADVMIRFTCWRAASSRERWSSKEFSDRGESPNCLCCPFPSLWNPFNYITHLLRVSFYEVLVLLLSTRRGVFPNSLLLTRKKVASVLFFFSSKSGKTLTGTKWG